MPTPDGISDSDWDGVRERAAELINHSDDSEADACRNRLMEYLSELENKYGRLPSILAARADFTRGAVGNEALLLEAFEIAERSSDPQAMLQIAHSLTELYVEDAWDRSKAAFWLRRFEALLSKNHDAFLGEEAQQLRNAYQSASRRAGR